MKKLLFACVCAATFAAFSDDVLNSIGFEGFTAGTTNIGNLNDNGQDTGSADSGFKFVYESANGSTDGSTVKAYGTDENLPLFNYTGRWGVPAAFRDETLAQQKYLELSTEGGTLWRSATETTFESDQRLLGNGFDMANDFPTLYVDTMVQFTPTEDGETPAVSGEDRIAIWLNVDATDEENPVTNLCVYAKRVLGDFADYVPVKFTVNNFDVQPGVWYRLTVKAFGDVLGGMSFPGFMVYIDGKLLTTDTPTMDPALVDTYAEYMTAGADNMKNGSVFISLIGEEPTPFFKGVGFKGSGAIDDFQIDIATPNFLLSVGALDFTLTWGEGISAVSYTINGGEATAASSGTAVVDVEANAEVAVTVTYEPWFVAGADSAATTFTVTEPGQTYAYTAQLAATPEAAGAGDKFGDLSTATVKTWADAKSLTPAQIAACDYALDAYLLNTGLDAAPALAITAIEEVADGWQITVKATAGDATVSLDGINGALKVKTAATLGALADAAADTYTATFDADGVATIKVTGDNKNFMKATVVAQ
ncbi:MAG: hypothetical protein IJ146_13280 [Kiritimatiellae bacterium]|nr:hypothetical protein [Kiritimatiellia bacterium]